MIDHLSNNFDVNQMLIVFDKLQDEENAEIRREHLESLKHNIFFYEMMKDVFNEEIFPVPIYMDQHPPMDNFGGDGRYALSAYREAVGKTLASSDPATVASDFVKSLSPWFRYWMTKVFNKKIKSLIPRTVMEEMHPEIIRDFFAQVPSSYKREMVGQIGIGDWAIEPEVDGYRAIFIWQTDTSTFVPYGIWHFDDMGFLAEQRANIVPYRLLNCDVIVNQLNNLCPGSVVDGMLVAENRAEVVRKLTTGGGGTDMKFYIHDIQPLKDWRDGIYGKSSVKLSQARSRLSQMGEFNKIVDGIAFGHRFTNLGMVVGTKLISVNVPNDCYLRNIDSYSQRYHVIDGIPMNYKSHDWLFV